jgi:predicted transcriptional regulator
MNQTDIKAQRQRLRLSQSALARLSGVPRIRICLHELGDRPLTNDEVNNIQKALRAEGARLSRAVAEMQQPGQITTGAD